jgi:hypothetical protein
VCVVRAATCWMKLYGPAMWKCMCVLLENTCTEINPMANDSPAECSGFVRAERMLKYSIAIMHVCACAHAPVNGHNSNVCGNVASASSKGNASLTPHSAFECQSGAHLFYAIPLLLLHGIWSLSVKTHTDSCHRPSLWSLLRPRAT